MVKIENTKVYNIVDALRGMRNPKNSWSKNDTTTVCDIHDGHIISVHLGENDKTLSTTLIKAGTEHRKFMRQIFVCADFTMPNYISNEFDTYKLGTVRNSCSVQHKGASREFTADDFTFDDMDNEDVQTIVNLLNKYRNQYISSKDYSIFRQFRQFMPMSYNYKFTWTGNYEILLNMYKQRKNHLLKEWHDICHWIESLPAMDIFLNA